VAAVLVALAILGFSALVPDDLPKGVPVGTTCTWDGSRLVVSGGLVNAGLSSAQFRITARVWIAGRPHALRRWAFAELAAFSSGRWAAPPYRYARKGLVGNAVERCTARARAIPPPSGED
jgi:hypothetical protein